MFVHYVGLFGAFVVTAIVVYHAVWALACIWRTSLPKHVKVGCSCEYFVTSTVVLICFGLYLNCFIHRL